MRLIRSNIRDDNHRYLIAFLLSARDKATLTTRMNLNGFDKFYDSSIRARAKNGAFIAAWKLPADNTALNQSFKDCYTRHALRTHKAPHVEVTRRQKYVEFLYAKELDPGHKVNRWPVNTLLK